MPPPDDPMTIGWMGSVALKNSRPVTRFRVYGWQVAGLIAAAKSRREVSVEDRSRSGLVGGIAREAKLDRELCHRAQNVNVSHISPLPTIANLRTMSPGTCSGPIRAEMFQTKHVPSEDTVLVAVEGILSVSAHSNAQRWFRPAKPGLVY